MTDPVALTVPAGGHTELAVTVWRTGSPEGTGPGPSLLALHPGIGDRRIWRWCAPTWAAAGHRVVAYDRRGFGDTRYRDGPHDDLDDLLAVAEATALGPAVLVANSMGGGLALDLALAHPDRVRGLILVAPSPTGYPDERWVESPAEIELDGLIAAAEERSDRHAQNRLEVRYWLDGTDQPEGRVTGPARDLLIEMNAQVLAAAPVGPAAVREPAWPRLAEIAVPTLVVAGEHDLPALNQLCGELTEAVPGSQLVTLTGAAHCPMLDQPRAFTDLVLHFLAALPPAPLG